MKARWTISSAMLMSFAFLAILLPTADMSITKQVSASTASRIAFVSDRDGNAEIYVMNSDGSNQTRLTNNQAADNSPAWSPDGTHIAFSSYRDSNWEIYVMNSDGGNQKRLTTDSQADTTPTWSPDGLGIVFSSERNFSDEFYIMNVDGSNQRRLLSNTVYGQDPELSSDGSRIAFTSFDVNGNYDISMMNIDGSNLRKLTNTGWNAGAAWSPNSTQIAFGSSRNNNEDIYIMNADGTNQTPLTSNNPTFDENPTWSPDGTHIAFYTARDGNDEIYVMNSDGSNQTRLTTNVAQDYEPVWSPTSSTPTPTPTRTPNPTATPNPTPTSTPTPTPAGSQCRTVGSIKVCADHVSGDANNWTASGTVTIGDYTFVENATLTASSGSLNGTGLVSMITSADGRQRTALFRDSFDINTSSGVLTPRAVSGYQLLLTKLVGFTIQQNLYQLTLDVLKGQVSGSVNLNILIPNNALVKAVGFTLDHNGAISGSLSNASFALGLMQLNVQTAILGPNGLTLTQADLKLPVELGGAKAALSVGNARITSNGQLTLASGSVSINFPNIHVGGNPGFGIEGAKASLSIVNGEYRFNGAGTFVLPGVGSGTGGCKIGTSFQLVSTPPPVREATLSIDGCFKVPIGTTGFFLTSVNGTVTLASNTVAVDLGIGVEGGPDIPGLGAAISGNPSARWDSSWAVGLKGSLNIFRWQAGNAALNLNPRDGLIGTLNLSVAGVIDGTGRLHVWKDTSTFRFTGRATVSVQVPAGAISNKCSNIGVNVCLPIPPTTITGPSVNSYFGAFRAPSSSVVYGLKGSVNALGYNPAFFLDANGGIRFDFGGLQEYRLIDQPALNGLSGQAVNNAVYPVNVGKTPALLVALGRDSGNLTLTLTDPTGRTITPSTKDSNTFYTATATQMLYTIKNPPSGTWTVTVGNRTGTEHYLLDVFGAPLAPAILQRPTLTANNTGYSIAVQATGAVNSTYSLYYDDDNIGNDGKPIATGLPLSQTSIQWNTSGVPKGNYYVYALVDDPFNAPVTAYNAAPVSISDTTPPATPMGLHVSSSGSNAMITWQASTSPDVAGYRIYYRAPNSGQTFVADVPNGQQMTYTQQGLYLNGSWEVAISAYDINNNESARSPSVIVTVDVSTIRTYLPLVLGPS